MHGHDMKPMIIIMIISGFLAVMAMWADKFSDFRYSINDVYMVGLMVAWMILLMGFYYNMFIYITIGSLLVILFYYFIRSQTFVTDKQYINGMIPHHSMAIHMSRQLNKKTKDKKLRNFSENIIKNQEDEIQWMKNYIQSK